MSAPCTPPYAEFVVKVSKFCNLRCRYCYEYPSLADPTSMSLEDVQSMFRNIGDYFSEPPRRLDFVWHGGEPLLLGPEFYRRVLEYQHEIFDPLRLSFTNSIQSNLTVMRPGIVTLLREVFDEIGVSVDLFGGNRVDRRGVDVQPRVLTAMQTLLDAGINFGCITVLSRSTAPHVDRIYTFFEDLNLSFRLLPIYRTGYAGQLQPHELSDIEIVTALKVAADRWFASPAPIRVEPIYTYVSNVLTHLSSRQRRYYDKEEGEAVFIIDTDGGVYSNGDTYEKRLQHGNVFRESFTSMRRSPGFKHALAESRTRVRQACTSCRFFGSCSGYIMGEATPEQRWRDDDGHLRCGVAMPMHQYVEQRLRAAGLLMSDDRLDIEELRRRAFKKPAAVASETELVRKVPG